MASEKKDKNLTCAICFDEVKNSKQLPCLHTFCCACLERYIKYSTSNDDPFISCPQCRQRFTVPSAGVDAFPSSYCVLAHCASAEVESGGLNCDQCGKENYAVGFCMDCIKKLCYECKEKHKKDLQTQLHHILVMSGGTKKVEKLSMCSIHALRELKFYCHGVDCKEPICEDCRLTTHYDSVAHPVVDIMDVARDDRIFLETLIEELSSYKPEFEKAVLAADDVVSSLKKNAGQAEVIVDKRRKVLHHQIDRHCDEKIQKIKDNLQRTLKESQPRHDDIQEDFDLLCRSVDLAKSVFQLGDDVKVVNTTKNMSKLAERYQVKEAKKLQDKCFVLSQDLHGNDVLNEYVGLLGFELITPQLEFSFKTNYLLVYGILPESATEAWVSYFTSEESALVLYDKRGNLQQDIALNPMGRSRVIKLGSNFLISSVKTKDLRLFRGGSLQSVDFAATTLPPVALAITSDNLILVVASESDDDDEAENELMLFTQGGRLVRVVKEENGKKIFRAPCFVAININGDIIVSDKGDHSVVILSKDLKVKGRYYAPADLGLDRQFCPRGICCDALGCIIVADGCNNRLHLISPTGQFIRFLLTEDDGLNWPRLVATGPDGALWVVCRDSIQVYRYLLS